MPRSLASEEETEAQFVARLVARDESAFNELVAEHGMRVLMKKEEDEATE